MDVTGRIAAVAVQAGPSFAAGNPTVAVDLAGSGSAGVPGRTYDVSPDGRRFLIIRNATRTDEKSSPTQLNIVLNWGEELKRLAPMKH